MSSKGKFVSGEEISKQLYVSRNAVWKAINSLRADGFIIDAAQNKGYLLSGGETDDFTRYGILRIRQLLKKSAADADITIKDTVTSTNTLLRISASLLQTSRPKAEADTERASTRLPTQAFICLCFSAPISKPTKRSSLPQVRPYRL